MITRKFLLASASLILVGLHHASADQLDSVLKCQTDAGPHPSFQELVKCDKQFLDKSTLDKDEALFERVAIKFTAYRTVSICADNNIGYNHNHSDALMNAIKSDPDIVKNIGPLYKDALWDLVSQNTIEIHQNDCAKVGSTIQLYYPNVFSGVEQNPFN
jgi:hypothetical protein